ncbi:hypothetical protein K8R33_00050 [archaeon]|nr:hypothetical protein [archaeon]
MKIKEERTELTVQHEGKDLTFAHPFYYGIFISDIPLYFEKWVNKVGTRIATLPQLISIIHDAFCKDQPTGIDSRYAREIMEIAYSQKVHSSSKCLWGPKGDVKVFPDNGLISLPDPLKGKTGKLTQNELEKMLEVLGQNPKQVKSIDKGYGEDELFDALIGEEGIRKLKEIEDHPWMHNKSLIIGSHEDEPLITSTYIDNRRYYGDGINIYNRTPGTPSPEKIWAFGVLDDNKKL